MTTDALLDKAPGPSPWYLRTRWAGYPGLYWEAAPGTKEMSGITFLKNDSGIVMLVDFYNYVSALDSYGLLIWHQRHGGLGPSDLGADFEVDLELE